MSKMIYNTAMIFINTICVLLLLKTISGKKYMARETWVFLVTNTIVMGIIYNLLSGRIRYIPLLTILFYIFTSVVFLKNSIYNSTVGTGLFYVLAGIGETICYYIFVLCMGFTPEHIKETISLNFLTQLMCFSLVLLLLLGVKIGRRKEDTYFRYKRRMIAFVFGTMTILIASLAYWVYGERDSQLLMLMSIFFMLIFSLLSTIYILVSQRLVEKSRENEELKVYIETIEELSEELKRFKHNHLNLLYGLGGYIECNEWEELKRYYEEIICESGELQNNNLFSMQKVKNRALFGLLSQKIRDAGDKGININLNASDMVEDIAMRDADLCEVIGIYLDNAIEAAKGTVNKYILVEICQSDDFTEFVIKNSFETAPDMSKLFMKKYTTKEKGSGSRGFGLYFAKRRLEQYDNVLYNTYIANNLFVQEVLIGSNS